MIKSQKTLDWGLLVIINFLWGTQVPVIRLIGDRLGPITVAFVPLVLSTLIFLPILWMENKKRGVKFRWKWNDIKYFILSGTVGIFIMQYAYTLGSQKTIAANAGIITLTIPVLVAIMASFMLNEKLNFVRIASFILALLGVLMTSVSDIKGADLFHGQYFLGNMIFLFACLCCAFYNTYCKLLVDKKFTELEILVYSSIIGSIASIPLLIWVEPFHFKEFIQLGNIAVYGILELSVFVYGIPALLFFYVLKRMDVTQAILGSYLFPFFIGLMGIVLLNEKISLLMVVGGSIIFVSTLMVTVYENDLLLFFKKLFSKKHE
ncbi:permease of the drug/metabolite transporter superfamily [Aquipluma nitroreducens]|uniref:Permease of the drug/metabolite transporter superfamily n=1 Tax=Aquipluma nitroreducens TaxID=2010828 RepID=A0A5K7S3Q9_9BACT|nr:DMT family transporter [Aquipluma nitroreducens]BBE16166.1 permease of the drug/metabolite transporter superfamily [Aquipluma nitroreducens]